MMFSIDFDEKIAVKEICGAVRDNPPDDTAKIPDGAVALTQSEDLKFLAGINHNTPFIFLHHINIMHDMLIACKELHWPRVLQRQEPINGQQQAEMLATQASKVRTARVAFILPG